MPSPSVRSGSNQLAESRPSDVGADEAKNLVDQLQNKKARSTHQFDNITTPQTQVDVLDGELLHVPVWSVRYEHHNEQLEYVLDANSGGLITSAKM